MLADKLAAAEAASGGRLLLRLAPRVVDLPLEIQKFDDPFLPWTRAVVQATSALVCGYVFDLAAYLALGAAGAVALERGMALVIAAPPCVAILDGRFATADFALMCQPTAFSPDAATVCAPGLVEAFARAGVHALVAGDAPPEMALDALGADCTWAVVAGRRYAVASAGDAAISRGWDFRESLMGFAQQARAGVIPG